MKQVFIKQVFERVRSGDRRGVRGFKFTGFLANNVNKKGWKCFSKPMVALTTKKSSNSKVETEFSLKQSFSIQGRSQRPLLAVSFKNKLCHK